MHILGAMMMKLGSLMPNLGSNILDFGGWLHKFGSQTLKVRRMLWRLYEARSAMPAMDNRSGRLNAHFHRQMAPSRFTGLIVAGCCAEVGAVNIHTEISQKSCDDSVSAALDGNSHDRLGVKGERRSLADSRMNNC